MLELPHRLLAALMPLFFPPLIAQPPRVEFPSIDLQQEILQVYRSGAQRFVIPPGNYRLAPTPQGPHLWLQDLSNFEIDATQVHLILTNRLRAGVKFSHCRRVRLLGATIEYETPPFTQGTIEAISPDGRWYDIQIDTGYPADFDDSRYFPPAPTGYLFDSKTRWWKPATYDLSGERIERISARRFRVFWARPFGPDVHPVAVGDLIAFRGSGPHNIQVIDSADVEVRGVTIYNSPDFAILESGGEGGNYYSVDVRRGPPPTGASQPPLLSSSADAFHSVNVRKGPTLENCHFESMGDDGIAIHGTFSHVMRANGKRLVISGSTFRPGDPVRIFDTKDRPAGEAIVETVKSMPKFTTRKRSRRDARDDNAAGPYFEITTRPLVRASFDYLAANPAAGGSGYVLRGNVIRNHRARGMLLKADKGLIENNIIDGSTMGGIVITPEFWWNEAGFSRHVVVRGNTIRHVAYAPRQLGALIVAALDPVPVAGCGHQDIRIEGNHLSDISGVNMLITSACNVLVRDNQFLDPQTAATPPAGSSWGEDGALIVVGEARNVEFANNRVVLSRLREAQVLKVLPSAEVKGGQTGIELTISK